MAGHRNKHLNTLILMGAFLLTYFVKPIAKSMTPVGGAYSATEYLAVEDEIQTPDWFILYGFIFALSYALDVANAKLNPEKPDQDENAAPLLPKPNSNNTMKSLAKYANNTMNIASELTEETLLSSNLILGMINPDESENNGYPALITTLALFAYLTRYFLLANYNQDKPMPRPLAIGNDVVFNTIKTCGLLNGLGQNWLYNGLGLVADSNSVTHWSISGGVLLSAAYLAIEAVLEHCKKLTPERKNKVRERFLQIEETAQANIFATVLITNSTATIAACGDDCGNSSAVQNAFYIANVIGLLLGIYRSLNLHSTKPHRIYEMEKRLESRPNGDIQDAVNDDVTEAVVLVAP